MRPITATLTLAIAAWACIAAALAQPAAFETRLAPVPIGPSTQASITGHGRATATLDGRRLTIAGEFEGLQGPASAARLHMSAVTGIRGPAIHDLEVTNATTGAVNASLALSAREVDALRTGLLYIQIDGENTPEGNLWGWLLP